MAAISQFSCFSSINARSYLHFNNSSSPHFLSLRPKLSVVMSLEGQDPQASSSGNTPKLSLPLHLSRSSVDVTENLFPGAEEHNGKISINGTTNPVVEKKSAKIHDFCFGIPFGGFVLSGGFLGFIFSRNLSTLGTGILFGGAVLALSVTSLKVWRQGKSSFPFIIGQAVLAATLLWKNCQTYSLP